MILKSEDKLLVVHRRLFEGDHARLFVGTVEDYENGIAKVTGFTFVRETSDGRFIRKEERRTKILSIGSGTLIVYQLPTQFEVAAAQIAARETKLVLFDGQGFEMNLSEHAYSN